MISYKQYLSELALTIQYHKTLNPAIWHVDGLSDEDTRMLVNKAWEFVKFSHINTKRISDIVVTGSNANYNYTKFSDIDVHVMCDESGLNSDEIYKRKVEWARSHKELKLHGYPIEMYIQDVTDKWPGNQGVYSLIQRRWLVSPVHLGSIPVLENPNTQEKIEHEINTINDLVANGNARDILAYKERLWKMRSSGLEHAGEFSLENVTYKDLRNRGLIDQLNTKLQALQSS